VPFSPGPRRLPRSPPYRFSPGAHAAEAAAAIPAYRRRNAVIGGTGFVTGVLFHRS